MLRFGGMQGRVLLPSEERSRTRTWSQRIIICSGNGLAVRAVSLHTRRIILMAREDAWSRVSGCGDEEQFWPRKNDDRIHAIHGRLDGQPTSIFDVIHAGTASSTPRWIPSTSRRPFRLRVPSCRGNGKSDPTCSLTMIGGY